MKKRMIKINRIGKIICLMLIACLLFCGFSNGVNRENFNTDYEQTKSVAVLTGIQNADIEIRSISILNIAMCAVIAFCLIYAIMKKNPDWWICLGGFIASVMVFIFTADISRIYVIDAWTILFVIFAVISIFGIFLSGPKLIREKYR